MSKEKRFVSLNLKMATVTLIGIFLAVCMYGFCRWVGDYVAEVRYTSEAAVERNVGKAYDSLEEFIEKNHVKATDTKALREWLADQSYTYLFIWDNENIILDAGWTASAESGQLDEEISAVEETRGKAKEHRIDEKNFPADVQNRIVEYDDGKYYTYIEVYKEFRLQRVMETVSLVLGFLTLLFVMLLYYSYVTRRIMFLASEVEMVSAGQLDKEIQSIRNDEIGTLAASVNTMRNSIIQKHKNEREAWEANNQLITSMSHDIRTPLTSLIGYLDIIEGKKYDSQEALDKYISSCREKAFQLKELSDKLFQYFLVFGNKENDKNLERFDASILFQQLLSEHCAEIISYGYKVEFYFNITEVEILADISGLRRLFDNIFSNIMKYADKKENVCIYAETENDQIKVLAINGMPEEAKKVESTRIGLKTCEKICSDLGGQFSYDEQDRIFTVRILLPIVEAEEPEAEETSGAEENETASTV